MLKKDLLKEVAQKTGLTAAQVTIVADAMSEVVENELATTRSCNVGKYGQLLSIDQEAKVARNPATGGTVNVAAKTVIKFKISKSVNKVK